ncbi:MAG: hypothetical protein ACR2J0_05135 [Mycobacteriales bacterium]
MYRSKLARARRRVLHAVERRTFRPATETLDLDELVSPLRYDVIVRAEYFDYLTERLDLYDADFDRYVAAATDTRYFTWFATVALKRYRPQRATDPSHVMAEFRARLRRSASLLRSFENEGFDPRYPVSVRTAVPGATTGTGKLVSRSYYPGDGCHRLALLVRAGQHTLPPSYYQVRRDPQRTVIDNTHSLIRDLRLTPEEYYRFLSKGYDDSTVSDAPSLLANVAERAPHRLSELRGVLAVDERAFVRPPEGSTASRVD